MGRAIPTDMLTSFDILRQVYRTIRSYINGVKYPVYHKAISSYEYPSLRLSHNGSRKVLFLVCWFETGGAEFFAFDRMKFFFANGYKVFALSTEKKGTSRKADLFNYCEKVVSLKDDEISDEVTFVLDFVEENSIDTIYLHHSTLGYKILPTLKKKFPKLKVVDSLHIIEPIDGGFVHLSGKSTAYIDLHHVISPSLKSYMIEKFKVNSNKILYFPLSFMSCDVSFKNEFDNLKNKSLRIVFLGRLVQQKRPYYFIEIARRLTVEGKKIGIDFCFDIYGDGPLWHITNKTAEKYGLRNLIFHGEAFDKQMIFRNSYALVLTSENEGIPLVCYEAIRHNTLCFSTNSGQIKDFLLDDFLVSVYKPNDLVEKIMSSVKSPEFTQALLEKQKQVLKDFDLIYERNKDIV